MLELITKILQIGGIGGVGIGTGVSTSQLANTGTSKGAVSSSSARFYLDINRFSGKDLEISIATTIAGTDYILAKFKKLKKPTLETIEVSNCPLAVKAHLDSDRVTELDGVIYCQRY